MQQRGQQRAACYQSRAIGNTTPANSDVAAGIGRTARATPTSKVKRLLGLQLSAVSSCRPLSAPERREPETSPVRLQWSDSAVENEADAAAAPGSTPRGGTG